MFDNLKITKKEAEKLSNHFKSNKPRVLFNFFNLIKIYRHKQFYIHDAFTNSIWWWKMNNDGANQRILFIQHLININK